MNPKSFAVTFDYRCPFACIAHDHVVEGLKAGADWDVTFSPFSLGQAHVEEGEPDIWEHPGTDSGLLALQAGIVVRDQYPDRFLEAHMAMFDARHVEARQIRDEEVVRDVLDGVGVDADAVMAEVASQTPLETIRKEHEAGVAERGVWGVPTFIVGERAAFVRLMDRSGGDGERAVATVDRILDLLEWRSLNEFKHTDLER